MNCNRRIISIVQNVEQQNQKTNQPTNQPTKQTNKQSQIPMSFAVRRPKVE